MLAGPGTCHRCDAEWSLKNLFPWGLHCQTVLRAAEEEVTDTYIKNIPTANTQTKNDILYVLTCITNLWSIYFLAMLGWKSDDSKNRRMNS